MIGITSSCALHHKTQGSPESGVWRNMNRRWRISFLLFFFGCLPACRSQTIPDTHAVDLLGSPVSIPRDLHSKYSVLIVGFSRSSGNPSRDWSKGVAAAMASRPDTASYVLPVLEGAPRIFRGTIERGMRKDLSPAQQKSYLLIFEKEREWKQTVSFDRPDDAYVLLVDQAGKIIWKTHGAASEDRIRELLKQLDHAPR